MNDTRSNIYVRVSYMVIFYTEVLFDLDFFLQQYIPKLKVIVFHYSLD